MYTLVCNHAPVKAYWQASDLWANRRQRREGADVPTHMYNCRAHGEGGSSGDGGEGGGGGAEGEIIFTTLIPGTFLYRLASNATLLEARRASLAGFLAHRTQIAASACHRWAM